MSIFRVEPVFGDDNNPVYRSAGFVSVQDEFALLNAIREQGNIAVPLKFEWGWRRSKLASDFPLASILHGLFSQRAANILGNDLRLSGDLLPVDVGGDCYWLFYCKTNADGIDAGRSEIIPGVGIKKAALTHDQWPAFFTLPQERQSLFVNDATKQAIEAAGLTGFDFQPLG